MSGRDLHLLAEAADASQMGHENARRVFERHPVELDVGTAAVDLRDTRFPGQDRFVRLHGTLGRPGAPGGEEDDRCAVGLRGRHGGCAGGVRQLGVPGKDEDRVAVDTGIGNGRKVGIGEPRPDDHAAGAQGGENPGNAFQILPVDDIRNTQRDNDNSGMDRCPEHPQILMGAVDLEDQVLTRADADVFGQPAREA
ncbi:hypothetical protein SMICM17S_11495 [Streptomyces microflavus]